MITRADSSKIAFPGGFIQPGESVLYASKRKIAEEALAYNTVGEIIDIC